VRGKEHSKKGFHYNAEAGSTQLAHLLFTPILRAHLADTGQFPPGWLRAITDKQLAPALRLMHGEPCRSWRLDELAKAAGTSRTTFATHFRTAAGVPLLTYLTGWRMRLARRALMDAWLQWHRTGAIQEKGVIAQYRSLFEKLV
jgi:AraC-like DNA-binding protein